MKKTKLLPFALPLALALAAGGALAAPQYTIVDLGVLGTDTGSAAFNISAGGTIVGRSSPASGSHTAFSWTAEGGMAALSGFAGRNYVQANGVSDGGYVVGTGSTSAVGANALPLIWQGGQAAAQLPLPAGFTSGKALDVNASGVAVGSVGASTAERAVVYANGQAALVPALGNGGAMVIANAVNSSGWVVGQGNDPASSQLRVGVVYDLNSGTSFSVGTLAGKNGAIAYDVSDSGAVVGAATQNAGGAVPFYWTQTGGMQAIPLITGATIGTARSVNASGWVVGTMGVGNTTPFLFDGTASYSIGDLLPAGHGWSITSGLSNAYGISDAGVITGTAVLNGVAHAYALVPTAPVPEPGSYALMFAGLGLIGWVARRRRSN